MKGEKREGMEYKLELTSLPPEQARMEVMFSRSKAHLRQQAEQMIATYPGVAGRILVQRWEPVEFLGTTAGQTEAEAGAEAANDQQA